MVEKPLIFGWSKFVSAYVERDKKILKKWIFALTLLRIWSIFRRLSLVADSQMTTGFFTLRPVKGWERNHSQMTMSFFMLQSWMVNAGCETTEDGGRKTEDGGRKWEKRKISNIEQGILNDEVRRADRR